VPIYIGATGMKMMEMTGEIADGVCLNYLVNPKYNAEAMDALERGAKKAGRSIDDIDRPQLVICSVDNDRKHALDMARKMMVQYLGQQPHLMKASGVSQELLDEIHQVLTWPATEEEIEGAMHLVPDDVVQMCTASGSPDEVKAKVREYIEQRRDLPHPLPAGRSEADDRHLQHGLQLARSRCIALSEVRCTLWPGRRRCDALKKVRRTFFGSLPRRYSTFVLKSSVARPFQPSYETLMVCR
jgi:alkanesulfonate monooxygenase SsuD/methylene tetrahydromethanopterin reductase-like flavin-dependent oxidoreductase (luciferase family)